MEGELPEDGLAAYGDDGDDLMMALARKIVSGDEEEDETVEAVFAQARDAEAASEEFLVDDGWKVVEVEPEAAPANGNGHHADSIGPTVELVLDTGHYANGNGHAAVPVNGNGRHEEAAEGSSRCSPGRSSWPRSRSSPRAGAASRSPQPRPCSIGRWTWRKSERRSRSARGARPQDTGGGHHDAVSSPCTSMCGGLFCCPEMARLSPLLSSY